MIKIKITHLNFSYNDHYVLKDITAEFQENSITAIVGPSGTGKSTLLMTLNRLWEGIPNARMDGKVEIRFAGTLHDIYDRYYSLPELRKLVGMVFQTPNPLPMSIYRNIAFPLKLAGHKKKDDIPDRVEQALRDVYLWGDVKDRLSENALGLSGGQQQRLCMARALILEPDILLLDEPTSSLDTKAGGVIEDLLQIIKGRCTILVVSHYLDQVKRIADTVMELSNGAFIPGQIQMED
ncbi:MAG: phosphate ABC transporter ATP-binding protein [Thermodesulfobacteriota bacterium]|nr:phosphate ABC transporter ATP-binding protein [Thermodesulfobacteriota bacterium]